MSTRKRKPIPSLRLPSCQFSRGCSHSANRPGPAAFPAGPRGGPCVFGREILPARRSRNRCEGESRHSLLMASAHHAISRVAAENASGPGLTLRLLPRCEPQRRAASRWRR